MYRQGSSLSDTSNPDSWCSEPNITNLLTPLLYNLNTDPAERWDLAASQPGLVRLLLERLAEEAGRVEWRRSEMERGNSRLAAPCCNKANSLLSLSLLPIIILNLQLPCTPWPACCDCNS